MKQFKIIFLFELKSFFKNKIFVGITIFLAAAIALFMFFPRIAGLFKSDTPAQKPVMLIAGETLEVSGIDQTFKAAFKNYDVQIAAPDEQQLSTDVKDGKAKCAFLISDDFTTYSYFVSNLSMYDTNESVADEILLNVYRLIKLNEAGLTPEQTAEIMQKRIEHTTHNLGKDQIQNFFYTYIMIFALYSVILLYGQMIASNVATEKSSKAMELLVTSAKPVSMMFGKVLAACIAGLLQLIVFFGTALLSFNLNKDYWNGNMIVNSIFNIPADLLIYMLVFFILGFFIYAFLYGAVGSTATKLEDINTSVMPITVLFIAGFLVVMISLASGNLDGTLLKICSYIPFTSPMAMFTRIAMSVVPVHEIIISIAVLVISVIAVGIISAKIYRIGVLLYGTKPKLKDIIKMIKAA